MVSPRCKKLVSHELKNLGYKDVKVELGVVDLPEVIPVEKRVILAESLHRSGLELMDNKKDILVERIKYLIIEMIHHSDEIPKTNYSDFISEKLNQDYTYLSNIFSRKKGTTIQQYIILNKIEKVKQLLLYNELNLSEISDKLHYSSIGHLSNQFKKVTGMSPTLYKKMKLSRNINI